MRQAAPRVAANCFQDPKKLAKPNDRRMNAHAHTASCDLLRRGYSVPESGRDANLPVKNGERGS